MDAFARRLLAWFDQHGRHDLPWQRPRTAYRVWVSEVMLQQTQVATVIPYFERFVAALPDLPTLAAAPTERVLALWSGLGYYRRAHNLQATARACAAQHHGRLPDNFDALVALPGIGRSTAGAILALAHDQRHPILDGNVKRVLCRCHGIHGWPGERSVEAQLWQQAQAHTPTQCVADYTQAIMDLGATVCTRANPNCAACPLARSCVARRDGLTGELPQARPARTLPERRVAWLVLRDVRGRVLLQHRPPTGVWPGLWSLPEAANRTTARALAARLANLDSAHRMAPREVQHAFTHFRLRATVVEWQGVTVPVEIADAAVSRWCSRADLEALGIPAPVRGALLA